jgi:glycine/D-amino acid oxidase-like deaminating enzyme
VISHDAVAELLVSGSSVHGVRLASGARIEADTVVLCAGWRTPDLAAQLDVEVPLVPADAPGSIAPCLIAYTTPARHRLSRLLSVPGLDLRPAEDGRLFLEAGDLDDRVDLTTAADQLASHSATLLQRAREVLPCLSGAEIAEYRVCVRPLPADGYPIIGRPNAVDGCYMIVTHSGVTLAAHLATLVAGEILTENDHPSLLPYRLQRFATGGRLEVPKS